MDSPVTQLRPTRFYGWRDRFVTPAVESLIVLFAALPAYAGYRFGNWEIISSFCVFYAMQIAVSIVVLKIIRVVYAPFFGEGTFSVERNAKRAYISFNLYGFILITNLFLPHYLGLIPPPFRKFFYAILGTKFGPGIVSVGGKIADPHLLEVERDAIIGDGVLLLGHAWSIVNGKDVLVFAKTVIEERAVVGARAVILPGVRIGKGAMVTAQSLVPSGTRIGAGEVWSGNPAKRIYAPRSSEVEAA